jgi:hypothetical protein
MQRRNLKVEEKEGEIKTGPFLTVPTRLMIMHTTHGGGARHKHKTGEGAHVWR